MKITRLGNVSLVTDATREGADVFVGDLIVGMFGTVGGRYYIRRAKTGGGYLSREWVFGRTDAILKLTGGDR